MKRNKHTELRRVNVKHIQICKQREDFSNKKQ